MLRLLTQKKFIFLGIAVASLLSSHLAQSATEKKASKPQLLISVGGTRLEDNTVAKKVCRTFLEAASKVAPYDIECIRLDDFDAMISDPIGKAESSGKFRMHFMLRGVSEGYVLKLENWAREDDAEVPMMQWKVNTNDLNAAEQQINGIVTNALSFDRYKDQIKAIFVGSGLGASKAIRVDDKGILHETSSGRILGDREAYEIYINETPQQKNAMRALTEIGVGLGLGTLNYWRYTLFKGSNPNEVDWHYDGLKGQARRFRGFSGIRFDDNTRDTNLGHSLAGTFYYQVARANGYNSLESTVVAFAASSFWEIISEYREVISINDQIFTPIGGLAIGEVGHQFGSYFYSKGTLIGKTLSAIFDAPTALNRMIDGYDRSKAKVLTRMQGFDPEAMKGYVDFFVGKSERTNNDLLNDNQKNTVFGLRGELVTIPYYDSEGKSHQLYTDTTMSKMLLQFTSNANASLGVEALFQSVLAAYHQKNIQIDAAGRKNGYSMMIGLSNAFSYDSNGTNKKDRTDDWVAAVHVLGTSLDVSAFFHGVQVRASIDVYGDFAMVHSYAIDAYKQARGSENIQSTLINNDYYYHNGITQMASLSIQSGRGSMGVNIRASNYSSVKGHDQFHDSLEHELHLREEIGKVELWASYAVSKNWKVRVSISETRRSGSVDNDFSTHGSDRKINGTIIYRF